MTFLTQIWFHIHAHKNIVIVFFIRLSLVWVSGNMICVTIRNRIIFFAVFVLLLVFHNPAVSSDNVPGNGSESGNFSIQSISSNTNIQESDTLIAGCEYSYPPFCIVDEQGNADGFSVELLNAAAAEVGLTLNYKVDYWDSLKNDLRDGKIQVLPLVGRTAQREKLYDFTFPYTTNYGAIFVRNDDSRINNIGDLSGKQVVVMKGDTSEEYVRRENVSSHIITVESFEIAFELLSQGKYDAIVVQHLMGTNLLKKMGIDNIRPVGSLLRNFRQDFCFAVRKGDKKLQSLLSEGLGRVIEDGTYDKLYEKWFSDILENERGFVLTQKEKDWLAAHPVIRLGFNPHMEPLLVQKNDGSLEGVYPSIFHEINKRLGLNIKIVIDDWETIVNKTKSREIDGLLGNAPSQSKACKLLRTKPIHSSYPIFYTRYDSPISFNSLDDLIGKKIAYHKEVKMLEIRVDEYKGQCELYPTKNTLESLRLLLEGKVDIAMAVNFENYTVARNSLTGLKIVYFDLEHEAQIATGIRDDWPELVGIINKGLELVGPSRIQELVSKWTSLNDPEQKIALTPEERKWLDEHPKINFGFTAGYEPLLIANSDGSYSGMLVDLLNLINQRLGTDFTVEAINWADNARLLNAGEIDGLLRMSQQAVDKIGCLRTQPHFSAIPTIFARDDSPFIINSLDDLAGKKVTYLDNSANVLNIVKPYLDDAELMPFNSILDAFNCVYEGKADVCIAVSTSNYIIDKYELTGLKPKLVLPRFRIDGVTGVRNDYPELVTILNKALSTISENELNAIHAKWSSIDFGPLLRLSESERKWLAENQNLSLGFFSEDEPYLIKNYDGSYSGLVPDVITLINDKIGANIQLVVDDWPEIVKNTREKFIDGALAIDPEHARQNGLLTTYPITTVYPIVYAKKDAPFNINSIDDLKGKVVAAQTDFHYIKNILDPIKDDIKLIKTDNYFDSLRVVFEGKADVALANSVANFLLSENYLGNVQPALVLSDQKMDLVIGVRGNAPEFASILDKALMEIGDKGINALLEKWSIGKVGPGIEFSDTERSWLSRNPVVKIGMPDTIPPYSFGDKDGNAIGIFNDYLNIISSRAGIQFDIELFDWPDYIKIARNGSLDVIPAVKVEPLADYVNFSEEFFNISYVIITRNDMPFIKDISWLHDRKVSVIEDSAIHRYLISHHSQIEVVPVNNITSGLERVSTGSADAYIGDSVSSSYTILAEKFSNLKIAVPADCPNDYFCFGVRKDSPELLSIFNKSLRSITEQEHNAILNKWMSVRYEQVTNWYELWIWVAIIASVPLVSLVFVIFWNRQLGNAVIARTEELERANKFTEEAINSLQDVFVVFNPAGNAPVIWNKSTNAITGYSDDEIRVNHLPGKYFAKEDMGIAMETIQDAIDNGWATCELNIITKDGKAIPADFILTRLDNPDGSLKYIVIAGRDITERKATEQELEKHRLHLEELVEERAEEIKKRNEELVYAMAQLKDTQAQLILFEKLGALKHLVSGIAHEINSPLGAISTSREILISNIKKLTRNMTLISDWLKGPYGSVVESIIENCFANRDSSSSMSPREKRSVRDKFVAELKQNGIGNPEEISHRLIELHIYNNIEYMLPMLKEDGIMDRLDIIGSIVESAIACDTIDLAVSKASKIVNALNKYIRKGGSGDKEASMDLIDIHECLDNVLTLFYNAIKYTVTLDFECDKNLPKIVGDSDELNQVWTNLIKNALDAMQGAGSLKIQAVPKDGGITVIITDSGCGMTDEVKARIFEPLFTTKPAGEGTGLGMDIVRKIVVDNHGGKIDIVSEPDRGTTISVWLPSGTEDR